METTYNKVQGKLIKEPGRRAYMEDADKFAQMLNQLTPGTYDVLVLPIDDLIGRMKRQDNKED